MKNEMITAAEARTIADQVNADRRAAEIAAAETYAAEKVAPQITAAAEDGKTSCKIDVSAVRGFNASDLVEVLESAGYDITRKTCGGLTVELTLNW